MTLPVATPIARFQGDGVTTIFELNARIFDTTAIEVVQVTRATGVELVLNSGFTVSTLGGLFGQQQVGKVTFTQAPASTVDIVLRRKLPLSQADDYTSAGQVALETIETRLDRLVAQIQDLQEFVLRSLRLPFGDSAIAGLSEWSSRANKLLGFGSSGEPMPVAATTPASINLSALAAALVVLTTADAWRQGLGLPFKLAIAHRNGVDQSGLADATWTKILANAEQLDTHGAYDTANSRFLPGVIGRTLVIGRVAWTAPEAAGQLGVHLGKNDALYTAGLAASFMGAHGFTFEGALVAGVVDHNATDTLCLFGYQDSPTGGHARTVNGAASQTGAIYLTFLS